MLGIGVFAKFIQDLSYFIGENDKIISEKDPFYNTFYDMKKHLSLLSLWVANDHINLSKKELEDINLKIPIFKEFYDNNFNHKDKFNTKDLESKEIINDIIIKLEYIVSNYDRIIEESNQPTSLQELEEIIKKVNASSS